MYVFPGMSECLTDNILQHRRVHHPRVFGCYGCEREFSSISGMMIHLEAGTCDSGVGVEEVNDWVFSHENEVIKDRYDYYKYRCPTCDVVFRFLSGLLQHVESQACAEVIDGCIEDVLDDLMVDVVYR